MWSDDPVYEWPHGEFRDFASWQEGIWSRHVAAAITPNALMSYKIGYKGFLVHAMHGPHSFAALERIKVILNRNKDSDELPDKSSSSYPQFFASRTSAESLVWY